MIRALALAASALILAACAKPAAQTNAANSASNAPAAANTAAGPAAAAPNPALVKVFTPDILGANITYLETITGPAFRTEGHDRIYKVGACEVIVGVHKGKIANIGVDNFSPVCSFPIAQYFASGYTPALPALPTFGDLKATFGGAYDADCLTLCGNAADPVISLTYQGSHADNFNNLLAQVPVRDDAVLAAYSDWGDKLIAKYGQAYVTAGKFHTGNNLQDVAAKDFAAIRPTTMRVGEGVAGDQ